LPLGNDKFDQRAISCMQDAGYAASIRAKPSMSVTWEVLPRACTCQTLVVPRCFYTLACSLLSLLQPDTVFSLIYMLKGLAGLPIVPSLLTRVTRE